MNEEVKDKWKTALTSGEYKQGIGALRDRNNQYCCLGVLCDIYRKETGDGRWEQLGDGVYYFVVDAFDRSTHFLPYKVAEWAGLESNSPHVTTKQSDHFTLAYLNDGMGMPFSGIAETLDSL